ncbi:sushi, nidogen and EGF-like domain-containing protein 1 [Amphiura filiformis]|uniref:sushi, nidogen and EGF-like domain-containing protein 1 n=1 Tax=Amphiura filiformis TaxID=82378 RepID=UPI003B212682
METPFMRMFSLILLLLIWNSNKGRCQTTEEIPTTSDGDDLLLLYNTDSDSQIPTGDDGFVGPITLARTFPYFGTSYNQTYIGLNGVITFTEGVGGYVSTPFPLSFALVSPYWADIDLSVSGAAYYREMPTRNANTEAEFAIVDKVLNECGRVMCQFQAEWLYVVSWVNVGYYGSSVGGSIVNSFQAILATDGTQSAGIFYFEDLNWSGGTTNDANSSTGLGGIGAQVGFNQGDGVRYFYLPGSRVSNEVINLDTLSNIEYQRLFAYRIDTDQIVEPDTHKLSDSYGNPVAEGQLCFDDSTTARVICEVQGCFSTLPITWKMNGVDAPAMATDVIDSSSLSTTSTLEFMFDITYDGHTLTCYADEASMCEKDQICNCSR